MTVVEILVALIIPPLAVWMKKGSTSQQVLMAFLLWILGWLPGVIYALFVITAAPKDLPSTYTEAHRR